jgi:hypothetical protein
MFHRERRPLSEIWNTIVTLYTSTKLSFGKDKLVAISGIAQQVHEESQDQYLAELWRKDIELQLLWVQQWPGRRLPRGSEYRAPSWSWASVDEKGFVYYSPRLKESTYVYHAHVIDAQVEPVDKDPFGELVGGVLRMSCSVMLAGKLKKIKSEKEDRRFDYNEVDIESQDGKKETFRMYPDSDEYDGEQIYVLPVLEIFGKGKYNKRNVKGLLLSATGNKGEYIRAGFFDISAFNDGHREIQERLLKLLESSGQATAEAQWAEILSEPEFPDEGYVITIIWFRENHSK